ncbi:MAG TPA: hypothetical protein VEH28_01370 [Thermoplasmata archaeon]|nr:hypothetical protein [Thermoplasmata archaeon]
MSCVEGLIEKAAREVEPEVKQRLQGFLGGFVRAYLPQTWVFRTEDGTASLRVDPSGAATAIPGAAESPDVTVEVGHDRLKAALEQRGKGTRPTGNFKVTTHTAKGRAAFDLLRERFGL